MTHNTLKIIIQIKLKSSQSKSYHDIYPMEHGLCLLEKPYPDTNIHQIKVSLLLLLFLSPFPKQSQRDLV